MSFDAEPIVGCRYRDLEADQEFEIIALDEYEGIITLHRDDVEGEEQVVLDEWYEMSLEPTGDEGWEDDVAVDDVSYDEVFVDD